MPARPRCSTCWTSRPSPLDSSSSRCMTMAVCTVLRCLTLQRPLCIPGFWRWVAGFIHNIVRNTVHVLLNCQLIFKFCTSRVWETSLVFVWRLAIPLWPPSPTLSSMATRESWLSLWKQTTPSPWQIRYAHSTVTCFYLACRMGLGVASVQFLSLSLPSSRLLLISDNLF